jgi:hypothetical protein
MTTARPAQRHAPAPGLLAGFLVSVGLAGAVIGSLGAPLITAVAEAYDVSLAASQWTLTIALLAGAVATPVVGRSGPDRGGVPSCSGCSPPWSSAAS